MISNKQSSRAYTAFLVTWSFVVLTVTGLVLYVVPQGRVASWIHWSFGGLGRDGWSDVHILFGVLFIATGVLHLYFNWKPFKNYLAERVRGQLALKRELVTSTATTLVLVVLAILHVPPVSWLFDLNDAVKASWAQGPGNEPPFGHAEEAPLPTLAQRTGIDLPAGLAALRAAGLRVDDERATLQVIASRNDTTPAAVYAFFPRPVAAAVQFTPADVEARLTGAGIGSKTLAAFSADEGLAVETALQRLGAAGISAVAEEKLKAIADRATTKPIELAKAMLVSGYAPQK